MAYPSFFSIRSVISFSLNIKLSLKVFDKNFVRILNLLIFMPYTLILLKLYKNHIKIIFYDNIVLKFLNIY